jgi:periplasmic protein TonB
MSVLTQEYYSPILSIPEKGMGKAALLCLLLSLFAHAGAMALVPDLKPKMEQRSPQILHVNLMSMAAPVIESAKIEPAAGQETKPDLKIASAPKANEIIAEPKPVQKIKPKLEQKIIHKQEPENISYSPPILSSNDQGKQKTTVIPVVKNVHIINQTPPIYPPRAKRMGQQGTVLLHALVAGNGQTQDLKIVSSSGHQSLDQSALRAVKNWTFASATKGGQPTKAWVEVPVEFILR